MKKIKLILVGYGPRGKNWLQIIKKNKKTEIIAICDINEKTKDKYNIDIPFYSKISHALLESKAEEKWGELESYKDYKKRTPELIPKFWK